MEEYKSFSPRHHERVFGAQTCVFFKIWLIMDINSKCVSRLEQLQRRLCCIIMELQGKNLSDHRLRPYVTISADFWTVKLVLSLMRNGVCRQDLRGPSEGRLHCPREPWEHGDFHHLLWGFRCKRACPYGKSGRRANEDILGGVVRFLGSLDDPRGTGPRQIALGWVHVLLGNHFTGYSIHFFS